MKIVIMKLLKEYINEELSKFQFLNEKTYFIYLQNVLFIFII